MRLVHVFVAAVMLTLPLPTHVAAAAALGASAAFVVERVQFVSTRDVLAHPVRRALFERILARVGVSQQQITDELGLTPTNAIWHLRKLEQANLVRATRYGGATVFYPVQGGVAQQRLGLGVTTLQNPNARAVCEHLASDPGMRQRELGRALGVNHGTVRWHLRKLQEVGVVEERRDPKGFAYFLTEEGREALRHASEPAAPLPEPRSSRAPARAQAQAQTEAPMLA